jgi:hypothetical protein
MAAVYPNPATTRIQASLPDGVNVATLRLHDLAGRQVAEYQISEKQQGVTHSLKPGLYVYTLHAATGQIGTGRLAIE